MINKLCTQYTYLNENEIKRLIEIEKSLQLMADFYECDVFIDVLTHDKDKAVVIAHSKPDKKSLYKKAVVGQMALRENEPDVLKTLETGMSCNDIRAITQEDKFVKQRIQPVLVGNKVIATVIVEKDISNEIKNNFNCVDSNKLIDIVNNNVFIVDHLDEVILIFDGDGKLIVRNNRAEELYRDLGYKDDIEGMHYDNLAIDSTNFKKLQENKGKLEANEVEEVHIGEKWFSVRHNFLQEDSVSIIKVIKDITDFKNKEAEIVLKSVAVREAHHRVKNNLQTVAALLRRQAKQSTSEEVKACLKESINRVMTIATTHDLLSKASYSCINVVDAMTTLIDNIKASFEGTKEIQMYVTGRGFEIHGEKATALLLTINEVVQNCYDHAFVNGESGTIQILVHSEENYKTIAVVDNGRGFDVNSTKSDSLGLFIIKSYATSILQGNLKIESSEQGTKVIIEFLDN